jgi:hypothetical protein
LFFAPEVCVVPDWDGVIVTSFTPNAAPNPSVRERYRIRQGRYRILYTIEDTELVVYVIRVGDRKNVYKALR